MKFWRRHQKVEVHGEEKALQESVKNQLYSRQLKNKRKFEATLTEFQNHWWPTEQLAFSWKVKKYSAGNNQIIFNS